MDIKEWLETTGYKVKEIRFLKAPPYPYIIFTDEQLKRGPYGNSVIIEHDLSIKLYTETIKQDNSNKKVEKLIEDLGFEYIKSTEWIEGEAHFQTTYDFIFIEKKKKEI